MGQYRDEYRDPCGTYVKRPPALPAAPTNLTLTLTLTLTLNMTITLTLSLNWLPMGPVVILHMLTLVTHDPLNYVEVNQKNPRDVIIFKSLWQQVLQSYHCNTGIIIVIDNPTFLESDLLQHGSTGHGSHESAYVKRQPAPLAASLGIGLGLWSCLGLGLELELGWSVEPVVFLHTSHTGHGTRHGTDP